MSDFYHDKNPFEVWNFPAFEDNGDSIEPSGLEESGDINVYIPSDDSVPLVLNVPEDKSAFLEQIQYLDILGMQMKKLLMEIDASLLVSMIALIRKTVKKIVLKELEIDENALKEMIGVSLAKINRDDETCIIHISEQDQSIFENTTPLQHVVIKTDATLQKGDYVIKSKLSELEAILEQRINTLLGI